MPGGHECPDLFELPVDGDPANTRWVAWEGGGRYLIGRFDGKTFQTESGPHASKFGANDYAAQTYSDIPAADGRRIQISWMAGGQYPDMPFNQQMSVPRVLTLRTTPEGIRLYFEPIEQITTLRDRHHSRQDLSLGSTPHRLLDLQGLLFDIEATFDLGEATAVGLEIRGHKVESPRPTGSSRRWASPLRWSPSIARLRSGSLSTARRLKSSLVRAWFSSPVASYPNVIINDWRFMLAGGTAQLKLLNVWELKSTWQAAK